MSELWTFVLAQAGEANAVFAWVDAAYDRWRATIPDMSLPDVEFYDMLIRQERVWKVVEGAEVLGICALWGRHEGIYIDNLAVLPQHQRRGIGTRMLQFAEARARAQEREYLTLGTHEQMTSNIAFYEKYGFHVVSHRDQMVWMIKDLEPSSL